jgi:hypothetical protein
MGSRDHNQTDDTISSGSAGAIAWQRLVIPYLIILVGGLITIKSGVGGAVVILIGFAWVTSISLAWALPVYIILSPFTFGLLLHGHHIALSDACAILMALKLLWQHRSKGIRGLSRTFFPGAYRWPVLLLLFLAVVSLVHAQSHSIAVIKILELVEFFVVVVAIAADLGPTATRWWPTLVGLFGIGVYEALIGMEQFLLGVGPRSFQAFVGHIRSFGSFGQPNVFGAFMADMFPIGLALYLFGPKGRHRPWLLVVNLLLIFSVWSSLSRGAWVADVAAIGLMGLFAWGTKGREVVARYAGYGVVLPLFLFAVLNGLGHVDLSHSAFASHLRGTSAVGRAVSIVGTSVTTQQRIYIWTAAFRAIRTHLTTGVGMGEFAIWIRHHMPAGLAYPPPQAHDIYLEFAADTGILGAIAILWLEVRWIVTSVRTVLGRFGHLDDFQYAMALGALGTFTAFIVQNLVDYMIDHGVILPLLLAMGFTASIIAARRGKSPDHA